LVRRGELHRLPDLEAWSRLGHVFHRHERLRLLLRILVGAAVVVLDPVPHLGLVRALVLLTHERVLVRIGIGATMLLERALHVRAFVIGVGDAVAVVVRIGAAVAVLEAVLVLGLGGALILVVADPVLVLIVVRAAVLLRVGVRRAGFVRARVLRVVDPLLVVVGTAAALPAPHAPD